MSERSRLSNHITCLEDCRFPLLGLNAFGIELESRDGRAREIVELVEFASMGAERKVADLADRILLIGSC